MEDALLLYPFCQGSVVAGDTLLATTERDTSVFGASAAGALIIVGMGGICKIVTTLTHPLATVDFLGVTLWALEDLSTSNISDFSQQSLPCMARVHVTLEMNKSIVFSSMTQYKSGVLSISVMVPISHDDFIREDCALDADWAVDITAAIL